MRRVVQGLILLALAAGTAGCGPELKREDLGEIQTEAGQLPGAGEKYPLPEPQYEAKEEPADKATPPSPTSPDAATPSDAANPPAEAKS